MIDELAVQRARDGTLRAPGNVALSVAIAAALSLLPLLAGVRAALGVGAAPVALSMGLIAAAMIAGAVIFRVGPASRLYRGFDRVETVAIQVALLHLIYAAGRADSFFWIPVLAHIMFTAHGATSPRFHRVAFIVLPAALAVAFLADRDPGKAATTAVIGGLGSLMYSIVYSVSHRLEVADRERARLAAELADVRVREDRERIARDIHDGIGADLAALDWRLRALRRQAGASASLSEELDQLAAQLAQGADALRSIVWALRTPNRSWAELVAYVRQRAAELCGEDVALELDEAADGGVPVQTGERALDFVCGVLEMVRNAVRHAHATRIVVKLAATPSRLVATVVDDGRGLPADALERAEGGLANLRHRAARSGGRLVAAHAGPDGGTRLELTLGA